MLLVKLITRKTRTARLKFSLLLGFFSVCFFPAYAQDNSPYSRYGLGDLVPPTHIIGRAMGGISAGYSDPLSINLNNPAAYSSFQSLQEAKSKKLISGRAVLDLGINFEARTLRETNPPKKFTANNALFSYLQVGMPIRKNWGISFGLKPVSRISYKILRYERLFDPITGQPIDSSVTRFEGDGGSYLPSLGTGFAIFSKTRKNSTEEKLSLGLNLGYLFGKKDYSTRRALINDTVEYYMANYQTKTTFGNLFLSAGAQYKFPINTDKRISMTLGAYGNWNQNLDASQDILRETFVIHDNLGELRLDSVSDQRDVRGKIIYPGSYTIGFIAEKQPASVRESGWLLGLDFSQQNWSNYRIYGHTDSVRNKWELRAGGQYKPGQTKSYFSKAYYRAGFFIGPDYIKVQNKLPQYGASLGMGLPIYSSQARNQWTVIQLAFEYIKRGNNNNLLQENMYRLSVGFSLSDFWFQKRKYD